MLEYRSILFWKRSLSSAATARKKKNMKIMIMAKADSVM